jgi:hypothetical protein
MKNFKSLICLFFLFSFSINYSFAQNQSNTELIADKAEADRLYLNFREHYAVEQVRENGGTISLATIKALYDQMVSTGSNEIVYRFGRTTPDNSGKNIVLFFNESSDETKLNESKKFKTVNVCPQDCNPVIDNYLR